jgi:hypothetical protein
LRIKEEEMGTMAAGAILEFHDGNQQVRRMAMSP